MLSLFQRSTRGILIVIAVLLSIFFTALVFSPFQRAPWYRQIIATILYPPQKVLTGFTDAVSDTWRYYFIIVGAAKENDELKLEIAKLNQRLSSEEETKLENERLRDLLAISEKLKIKGVGGRIISSDPRGEFKVLTIDKGYNDGITKDQVVIGYGGLMGRIGQVYADESTVFLISDPNSAVDVVIQRTGARAILVGAARKVGLRPFFSLSRLEYLRRTSEVIEDDVVVTSGLDRFFPAGIPVGTLKKIKSSQTGVFKEAEVVPFVDFGEVREVLVLK